MSTGAFIAFEGLDGAGKSETLRRAAAVLSRRGVRVATTAEPSEGPVGKLIRSVLQRDIHVHSSAMGALFAADRADHVARIITPLCNEGMIVLCDRYVLSNVTYRGSETTSIQPAFDTLPVAWDDGLVPLLFCLQCTWRSDSLDELQHGPDIDPIDADDCVEAAWYCPKCGEPSVIIDQRVRERMRWAADLLMPPAPDPDMTIIFDASPEIAKRRRAARGLVAESYEHDRTQRRVATLYKLVPYVLVPKPKNLVYVDASQDLDHVVTAAVDTIDAMLQRLKQ